MRNEMSCFLFKVCLHEPTQTPTREEDKARVRRRQLPSAAHILLDSSVSVEYPDWIKEGCEGKTASINYSRGGKKTRRK